jgi:hypothetical protein
MDSSKLAISVLPELFAICELGTHDAIPSWAFSGDFSSVTRTHDELSVVCPQDSVPNPVKASKGWKSLKVEGKLDFQTVGILSSIASALAQAGISIFTFSTFDTDYFFVREENLGQGITALRKAGYEVREASR